jgi:hypothetical protein
LDVLAHLFASYYNISSVHIIRGQRQITTFLQFFNRPIDNMTLRGIFDKDTFQKALSISIIHMRCLFLSNTKRPEVVEAKAGDESSEPMWELIWMGWLDETSTMFSSAMHQIEERQQHGSTQFLSYRGMPRIIYHSDESWKPIKLALHTAESTVTKLLAHLAPTLHEFCYY